MAPREQSLFGVVASRKGMVVPNAPEIWRRSDAGSATGRESLPLVQRFFTYLSATFEAERGRWFLWFPVVLSGGIAAYFFLPVEPAQWAVAALALLSAMALVLALRGIGGVVLVLLAIFLGGIVVAKVRVEGAGPGNLIMPAGFVEVSGWLERAEKRASGSTALIMRPFAIQGVNTADLPRRVRLIWRGKTGTLYAGNFIALKARFLPRRKPVWPGGYDGEFFAWFAGIGASGFAISTPETTGPPANAQLPFSGKIAAGLENQRGAITNRILAALPGTNGNLPPPS